MLGSRGRFLSLTYGSICSTGADHDVVTRKHRDAKYRPDGDIFDREKKVNVVLTDLEQIEQWRELRS